LVIYEANLLYHYYCPDKFFRPSYIKTSKTVKEKVIFTIIGEKDLGKEKNEIGVRESVTKLVFFLIMLKVFISAQFFVFYLLKLIEPSFILSNPSRRFSFMLNKRYSKFFM